MKTEKGIRFSQRKWLENEKKHTFWYLKYAVLSYQNRYKPKSADFKIMRANHVSKNEQKERASKTERISQPAMICNYKKTKESDESIFVFGKLS